jgi:hypothetical protein
MTELPTTDHGVPIDDAFAVPAAEDRLQRAAAALTDHGLTVEIVDTVAEARARVGELLPTDETVFTSSSETLGLSGITEDIDESGRYRSTRQQLADLDAGVQGVERMKLGALPDVIVGSVHAVTEDGHVVTGSFTGSQLGPYAAGAGKVIWVVGAQKVVADLDTALRRLRTYSFPREDERLRAAWGIGSALNKILIVSGETTPGRITVVLAREAIGF